MDEKEQVFFEGKFDSPTMVFVTTMTTLDEFHETIKSKGGEQVKKAMNRSSEMWKRPDEGKIEVKFDSTIDSLLTESITL